MKTVFKYNFTPDDIVELQLPGGATILHCAEQYGYMCLWALVDPTAPLETRRIRMAGTGHPIPEAKVRHINTIVMHNGSLVFHFFEL